MTASPLSHTPVGGASRSTTSIALGAIAIPAAVLGFALARYADATAPVAAVVGATYFVLAAVVLAVARRVEQAG